MISKMLSYVLSLSLLLPGVTFSHQNSKPPVDVVPAIPGAVEENRAGYGWLNASSESEADAVFRQECPRPNASGNVSLCIPQDSNLQAAYHLADNNLNVAFTRLAQENAYEELVLQRAAVGGAIWDAPDCVKDSPRVKTLRENLANYKAKKPTDLNKEIVKLTKEITKLEKIKPRDRTPSQLEQYVKNKEKRLTAIKLRAMRQSYDTNRMAQAMLLDQQLLAAQRRTDNCNNTPRKCMSIKRNRDRIRLAFPSIFPGGLAEEEAQTTTNRQDWEHDRVSSIVSGTISCNKTPYERMEISIKKLMGYNGAPTPLVGGTASASGTGACQVTQQDAWAIERGNNQEQSAYAVDDGYTQLVQEDDEGFWGQAHYNGQVAETISDPRMKESYDQFTAAVDDVKKVAELRAGSKIGTICSKNNLRQLARSHPQAVRQAVMDQNSPRARVALTGLLCQSGAMDQFQANDDTLDCSGVTGDPDTAAGMTVARTNYGFPYASDSNYILKKLDDGTMEVTTKINYVFAYDASIDPAAGAAYAGNDNVPSHARMTRNKQQKEFEKKTKAWVANATKFFNKNAAKIGNPKVKFKIERCTGCSATTEPLVNVSKCYSSEQPEDFATNFPTSTWDPSRCWYKNKDRLVSDGEDAGNFTLGTDNATIMHETGHNFGLADEYVADYYPAHPVGENGATDCNSTMGSTEGNCYKFYPRHFLEITRPARACPKP